MPTPSHVREYPVVECDLEFVELTRLGVPLEVHAADPSELRSISGRPVPEHGAFVARVLPRHVTSGDDAGLTYTHDDTYAKASTSFTRVWARDPEGGAVVVPAPLDGPLRDHLDELVVLSDDWFVLGLRFEADPEIRRVFNLHGFTSIARGHLRLFVVPSAHDGDARARVFVTCGGIDSPLAKLTSTVPLFHVDEPPALEMLRAYVEGPTSAAFPSTHDGEMNRIEVTGSNPACIRTAEGLFPHQARTARWMAAVEASDGSSDTRGDGSSDDTRGDALVSPVRFAGRVMHPDGVEHTECETREDALNRLNLKRQKSDNSKAYHSGPYATIGNALAAALTSSSGEKDTRGTRMSAVRAPRLPPGGLIAHPVGAGKTVICAAFLARERRDETSPARDGSSDTHDGSSDEFDGNTLVVCPAHIVTQWLEALRRFAPNLRCRRADAGDIGEINELKASDSSRKVDCTFDVEDRRRIDDAADWDVIVCAHEDVPEEYVRGSTSESNPGPAGGKTRTHPLWDYEFVGPVTKDGDEEAENPRSIKNGIRWRRLIVDEPQELDFTWRLNRYAGNGAWLTMVLNAKHRWAADRYAVRNGRRRQRRGVPNLWHGECIFLFFLYFMGN